ncbi:hypothetical protein HQP42_19140 [Rhodococcus fascians]|nr:hypothetical protein [Rhodococcus fascians]MBY3827305.1 hypothetical protein [Rhodococcus fascians]MBY3838031.1 hypothetical protein [Rhodococcus fascians]MBY3867303.1 hypothetical protein [Rhodococcus fascians]MBY3886320.1 hypothetical protein [Rhodococcus fascians]
MPEPDFYELDLQAHDCAACMKPARESAVQAYVATLNRFTEGQATQGELDFASNIEERAEQLMFDEHHTTRCPQHDFEHLLALWEKQRISCIACRTLASDREMEVFRRENGYAASTIDHFVDVFHAIEDSLSAGYGDFCAVHST